MKTTSYKGITVRRVGLSFYAMDLEVAGHHTSLRSIKGAITEALAAGAQKGESEYARQHAAWEARALAETRRELAALAS